MLSGVRRMNRRPPFEHFGGADRGPVHCSSDPEDPLRKQGVVHRSVRSSSDATGRVDLQSHDDNEGRTRAGSNRQRSACCYGEGTSGCDVASTGSGAILDDSRRTEMMWDLQPTGWARRCSKPDCPEDTETSSCVARRVTRAGREPDASHAPSSASMHRTLRAPTVRPFGITVLAKFVSGHGRPPSDLHTARTTTTGLDSS